MFQQLKVPHHISLLAVMCQIHNTEQLSAATSRLPHLVRVSFFLGRWTRLHQQL